MRRLLLLVLLLRLRLMATQNSLDFMSYWRTTLRLFVGSEDAAAVNTTFVSLLASCAMHRLEPWAYLRDLFCLLPSWSIRPTGRRRRKTRACRPSSRRTSSAPSRCSSTSAPSPDQATHRRSRKRGTSFAVFLDFQSREDVADRTDTTIPSLDDHMETRFTERIRIGHCGRGADASGCKLPALPATRQIVVADSRRRGQQH